MRIDWFSYTSDIRECATMMVSFHFGAAENKLKAIYKKYLNPERGAVALTPPTPALILLPV